MSNKVCKRTSIAGQALIEGILMRGPQKTAIVCRKPGEDMGVKGAPTGTMSHGAWARLPGSRGVVSFSVGGDDGDKVSAVLKSSRRELGYAGFVTQPGMAKVSVVGAGMSDGCGVAATMLRALQEGGIEPQEAHWLREQAGGKLVTLGPRILRTETAPLAAITGVMLLTGNME